MVTAIVGANWGDEGKGKITDLLASESDIVIRFQGGANAGHTIINDHGRFALQLVPGIPTPMAFFSMLALSHTAMRLGTQPRISFAFATANATAIGSVHPMAGTTSRFTSAIIRFLSS